MVFVLALAASLANALTSILQRMGVETAPASATLRLRLVTQAVRKSTWMLGFLCMVGSFVAQAIALHLGRLTEVQPILTSELLFLVLLLATWFRFSVGVREWLGAAAAGVGLAGFLVFANPGGGNLVPTATEWIEVGASCAAVVALSVVLALRGPRWWRAAMFGTGSAVGFAFTASLTKVVTGYAAHGWYGLPRHWETYGLAGCGLVSFFLAQNAFHAGPIAASQSTLVLVDPLASMLIGIGLFGDQLRTSGAWGPLEAFSLLVLFGGALSLCRSPLVQGVKGGDGRSDELLSDRARVLHHRLPAEPMVPRLPNS
jgi:hypothetical protein